MTCPRTAPAPPLYAKMCADWHKQPGCHTQPFFNLPLENVVVDELHLMLRVTDRLEEGLILDIIKWDEVNVNKPLILFFMSLVHLSKILFHKTMTYVVAYNIAKLY